MTAVLNALVALLSQIVPALSGQGALVTTIINTLVQIIPVLIQESQDVLPEVKNIIAVLKDDPATTQEQFSQLAALDAQVDAAFDAAVKDVQAQDGTL